MSTTFFKRILDNSIFSMAILLAFLLFFESYVKLPSVISWLGHFHPLILHFPIVLILVAIVQFWRNDANIFWYLAITTLLTFASAITGIVLSLEGEVKGELILTHQWLGVSVSYLLAGWYWFSQNPRRPIIYYKIIHGGLVMLIILTGHFGGMITHGKEFLAFEKINESEQLSLPDDPNVFEHIVQPILDRKCVSCHNQNKSKGELLLTDYSSLMLGGKSGQVVDKLNFSESELLKRLILPVDDEDHMPPEDEDQLSESELIVLGEWIKSGADNGLMFSQLEHASPLHPIIQNQILSRQLNKWNDLPTVSDEKIAELSSEYCNILRMYNSSDALQILIFPYKEYGPEMIEKLKPLARNIIELDLSNLPLADQEMKTISGFSNIEKLNMSNTPIDDNIFSQLGVLEKLEVLKVYNTQFGPGALTQSLTLPNLAVLYVFNTAVDASDIITFKEKKSGIHVVQVSEESLDFKSVLPPPTIEPLKYFFTEPFYAKLKHPLTKLDFNFTTDGSDPDVNSPKIIDSIFIENSFTMKYFASKAGWESSAIDSITFLKSVYRPQFYELENAPNPKYQGRGKSLLFDLEKGPEDRSDSAWMAFRNDSFILTCEFEQEVVLNNIVLSSMVRTDPYIFPPSSIQVTGGLTSNTMKLLGAVKPEQLKDRQNAHDEYYECTVKSTPVKYIKIVVQPLRKIPIWHQGKGEPGWFFIDELIFQ